MAARTIEEYACEVADDSLRRRRVILRAREIGPLPEVAHPRRRARASRSILEWCRAYLPSVFSLPFSDAHRSIARKFEEVVLRGGCFAYAMPRGSGKTSLSLATALWAVLHGHAKYVLVVTANGQRARQTIQNLILWLTTARELIEDYPEACYPILRADGSLQRMRFQLFDGKPTHLRLTFDRIVLASIDGSKCSGALIQSVPLRGGSLRGLQHALPDGRLVRPQLILIDDPQTRDSAMSPRQCEYRRALIQSDILGTMAHDHKAAVLCTCTVIRRGDLSDQLLSLPEWSGERIGLLRSMPTDMVAWSEYERVYREAIRVRDYQRINDYYLAHRAQLDAGAVPFWEACYDPRIEVSAIQHAMHLYFQDRNAFYSEYQNEPAANVVADDSIAIAPESVASAFGDFSIAPSERVGIYVDVQERILYYAVVARENDRVRMAFSTWPEQHANYYSASRPALSLEGFYRITAPQSIERGLHDLLAQLRVRYPNSFVLVDAGYRSDIVSAVTAIHDRVYPAYGRYVGARSKSSVVELTKPGDVTGNAWRMTRDPDRATTSVLIDTNRAKTSVANLFASSSVEIARTVDAPVVIEHLTSETGVATQSIWRQCVEWTLLPARENHYFDCLVGALVAREIFDSLESTTSSTSDSSSNWLLEGLLRYRARAMS